MDTTKLVFLDTETTNLYPDGEIWELAFDIDGKEYDYFFKPQRWYEVNAHALKVGGYYERTKDFKDHYEDEDTPYWADAKEVAPELAALLEGRHIVGAVPNFDENFLRNWFKENNAVLTTHYHLIDIEAMAVGYMLAKQQQFPGLQELTSLPWKSDDLSRALGVDPERFDRHTALGDVRWVKAQWNALIGSES